jgi:hypothetical protein
MNDSQPDLVTSLRSEHLAELRAARIALETPSFAMQAASVLGTPIEKGLAALPAGWQKTVRGAVQGALEKAAHFALSSMESDPRKASEPSPWLHKLMTAASGAAGGAFGLAALPLELPVSTCLILRSIADIARSQGHDIGTAEGRLDCLAVFALGSDSPFDDAAESGYWAARAALGAAVSDAAAWAARGATGGTGPALVRLLDAIAGRFGATVGEQLAAKAVPVAGAVAGAAVNLLFMGHYQRMATAHFTVRRLERLYGPELLRRAWDQNS